MRPELIRSLFHNGIVLFGLFGSNGDERRHMQLRWDLLPAYPAVLRLFADEAAAVLARSAVDRIVCRQESLAFGTGAALISGISLVYRQGKVSNPVIDFVGAYDVGHPTAWLMNELSSVTEQFLEESRKVGLDIRQIICIYSDRETLNGDRSLPIYPLLTFETLLQQAVDLSVITPSYATCVRSTSSED